MSSQRRKQSSFGILTIVLMLQPIIAAKTTWRLTRDLVLMNLYTHEALYEGLFRSD